MRVRTARRERAQCDSNRNDVVGDERRRLTLRVAPSSTGRAPHERPVAGVEFRQASFFFHDIGAVESPARTFAHDRRTAERRCDPHPAVHADATRHDRDHGRVCAQCHDRIANLGDRKNAEVRFLQADAAGVEDDRRACERAARAGVGRALQSTRNFRTADFADRTAKIPAVGCDDDRTRAVDRAASDDDAINKQKVFTDVGGVKDLLSFGDDTTRGIADLGTDGQQLVWVEGTERPQPNGVYPNVTAFVSPFTTEPAQIQKRALRSDLSGYGFGTSPFVVGCGYATRSAEMKSDGGFASGTQLIRLSDGYAWRLPDGPNVDWGWRRALAVTCDEVFILLAEKPTPTAPPRTNIARVRIDSLGPPTPP